MHAQVRELVCISFFCHNFYKHCPISTKFGMHDLTLKWYNRNKFGEFAISISGFIVSFYSYTPHLAFCKPIQSLVSMTICQVIDKIDTKLQRLPLIWGFKELLYFKLNIFPCYQKSEHKMATAQNRKYIYLSLYTR